MERQSILSADEPHTEQTSILGVRRYSQTSKIILFTLFSIFIIAAAIVIVVVFTTKTRSNDTDSNVNQQPIRALHGAVSSGNTFCNQVGVDVLKEGGNAIDAAIATAICIGPRNFASSGIGGGGVFLIRLANGTIINIDGRETAPASAHREMFLNGTSSTTGGKAIAVPGEIKVMDYAFRNYGSGKVSWYRLFEPTINFTRNGFPIESFLDYALKNKAYLGMWNEEFRRTFAPNGETLKKGDIVTLPTLSATLKHIATYGADVFYTDSGLVRTMVEEINEAGGNFTVNDFINYSIKIRDPIISTYRNYTVIGAAPPLSGGVCFAQILNMLELYNVPEMGWGAEFLHLLAETFKFAFGNRLALGDPDYVNLTTIIPTMLSKQYAQKLAERLSMDRTYLPDHYLDLAPNSSNPDDFGTTHITVIDKDRNAVAFTTTINGEFGSGVLGPRTGILYNNEMDDFSSPGIPNQFGIEPSPANFIAPGKRPLSSMSPTIILDSEGKLVMALGAAGGPRILTSVLQTIIFILDFHKNIKEASLVPRIHHQLVPHQISLDPRLELPEDLQAALREKGHVVQAITSWGNVHGITVNEEWLEAASDWRFVTYMFFHLYMVLTSNISPVNLRIL